MNLIQAGFPDTKVKTLNSARTTIIQRFLRGGPQTARVEDEETGRHYVLEVNASVRRRGGPNPRPKTGPKRHQSSLRARIDAMFRNPRKSATAPDSENQK